MPLPFDPTRLATIRDFVAWRTAVEQALASLDARLVASRASPGFARAAASPAGTGEAYVWCGQGLPYDAVAPDGTTLAAADYPALADVLGGAYDDGTEPPGHFRLPDLGAPPAGVWVLRT